MTKKVLNIDQDHIDKKEEMINLNYEYDNGDNENLFRASEFYLA
jgi:hypothetical protein